MPRNVTRLVGWKGVQRDLKKLPFLIDRKKFFLAVFRKAAGEFVKAARAMVPTDTNVLKKAIKVFVTGKGRKMGFVTVGVKLTKGQMAAISKGGGDGAVYGALVEYGTSDQAARPYMRPAYDSNIEKVWRMVIPAAKQIVKRAAKGVAKGKSYYELKV